MRDGGIADLKRQGWEASRFGIQQLEGHQPLYRAGDRLVPIRIDDCVAAIPQDLRQCAKAQWPIRKRGKDLRREATDEVRQARAAIENANSILPRPYVEQEVVVANAEGGRVK